MSTISVRTHFAAGHRIIGLGGLGAKCRNIHGHTFHVTWVFAQMEELEFGTLKYVLRDLITKTFDHGFILDKSDDFCNYLRHNMLKYYELDEQPTTEAIAAEIARLSIKRVTGKSVDARSKLSNDPNGLDVKPPYVNAKLLKVIVDEGPDNTATWEASSSTINIVNATFGGSGGTNVKPRHES